MRRYVTGMLSIVIMLVTGSLFAQNNNRIIVDNSNRTSGKHYTSIQDAINSITDSAATTRIIYIKKGIYHEKLFVKKHNIKFEGEDRDHTIITSDIARDEWRCDHPDDWGVATLNLDGNDLTFENLSIQNDYGFNNKLARKIYCAADTVKHEKIINNNGHQMALRSFRSTRLRVINCRLKAYAGDTVSPWNLTDGMFYFKDCIMEGGVDFYCPRGYAYADNCKFFANTGAASIWHDGSGNPDYKTVLINCSFDGFKGFNLGRYHKDAQFYLINCCFTDNMADKDIYLVPTANVLQFGRRIYYYNCHKTGGSFNWYANNLNTAPGNISVKDINVSWVFKNRWHPDLNN